MFWFVFQRLLSGGLVLFMVASLTFLSLRWIPGGPFDAEAAVSPVVAQNLASKYQLGEPLWKQYTSYMKGLCYLDFGTSYQFEDRPVAQILKEALPATLILGLGALFIAIFLGTASGAMAGFYRDSLFDRGIGLLAMAGVSLPSFLVGPLFILFFAFGWPLELVSPGAAEALGREGWLLPSGLWLGPRYWILPILTLSVRPTAFLSRLTRASVLDFASEDFVKTARSKGIKERQILEKHILKNALTPLLAYGGPMMAGLLSGSFVVEVIFAVPGIAKYFVQSVFYRDYPVVMAMTLVYAFLLVVGNVITDTLQQYFDPRIQKGFGC